MEDKSRKKEKIEKIIPLLWYSYEHMYSGRNSNTQNRINFLLVVVSFLPIIGISLYTHFDNTIFFVPILFQLASLLILLRSFFFSGAVIPWFEIDETLNNIKNDTFYEHLFAELKAFEDQTFRELRFYNAIIQKSLWLVLFSIYSTILATLFQFFVEIRLYLLTIFLTLILFILVAIYRKDNKDSLETSRSTFDKESKQYRKTIDEWLEK